MQNFGKADRTTDELFEVYQINFNRQQSTALNLQKHVKNYLNCLKELHEASKGLSNCLLDMHEKDWPKHDAYEDNAYDLDHANQDLEEKIKESVLVPLEQYLGQFLEMREKIAKRGRKLVDYDSQRHSFEALQASQSSKQPDDAKLSKHRDQLEEARRVYDTLNNELHDELPALYDNRLPFVITVFQRLFSSEIAYHNDSLNIFKSYLTTIEQLAKATEKGILNTVRPSVGFNHQSNTNQVSSSSVSSLANKNHHQQQAINSTVSNTSNDNDNASNKIRPSPSNGTNSSVRNSATIEEQTNQVSVSSTGVVDSVVPSAPSANKAPVLLHKVRATYNYMAVDEDELSFDAGEIIQVIEYDDPQEQEEGWLMGIKESDGTKGLFPANFTKEL